MYGRIVEDERPYKEEWCRTRLTVGGNFVEYDGNISTPTSELDTIKTLYNSVVSTLGNTLYLVMLGTSI